MKYLLNLKANPIAASLSKVVGQIVVVATLSISLFHAVANGQELEALQEQAIQNAVKQVEKSVVRIETIGGAQRVGKVLVGTGPTTGLIVDKSGYIISSAFNFIQKPSSILITLPDKTRVSAKIVSRDESRKLVLLKVKTDLELPVPAFVAKNEIQVGQWSIALGRTLSKHSTNVSVGIVSALNRVWGKAIQTDAKISPMNYGGPLVDIHGRVLGVLVPMSPQGNEEVAGTEWYDSGIGFAVPLVDIFANLEQMKSGKTIKPGLLGVSLKGENIYVDKPIILNCSPNSPAAQAGVKANDQIVEINGLPVARQSELKHAIGNLDAGQLVKVGIVRGAERINLQFELASEILPYDRPFLGILPQRSEAAAVVKHVFAESAAAKAGLKKGDRITRVGTTKVASIEEMVAQLQALQADDEIEIELVRGDEQLTKKVRLDTMSLDVPKVAIEKLSEPLEVEIETGVIDLKLVGEENRCLLLVPKNIKEFANVSCVVALSPPGILKKEAIKQRWEDVCQREGIIVVAPESLDPKMWSPTETDFVRKSIERVMNDYPIDSRRVVVWGEQAGGTFAFLTTFAHRDLVRCVISLDGSIPSRLRPPETDPKYPLSIYLSQSKAAEDGKPTSFDKLAEILTDRKFPTISKVGSKPSELYDEILSWIQTLDRI